MNDLAERELRDMAGADFHYQQLLCKLKTAAEQYEHILASLPPEMQEQLENYISLCEELEYRRTCLAYCLGTRHGVLQGCIVFPET